MAQEIMITVELVSKTLVLLMVAGFSGYYFRRLFARNEQDRVSYLFLIGIIGAACYFAGLFDFILVVFKIKDVCELL